MFGGPHRNTFTPIWLFKAPITKHIDVGPEGCLSVGRVRDGRFLCQIATQVSIYLLEWGVIEKASLLPYRKVQDFFLIMVIMILVTQSFQIYMVLCYLHQFRANSLRIPDLSSTDFLRLGYRLRSESIILQSSCLSIVIKSSSNKADNLSLCLPLGCFYCGICSFLICGIPVLSYSFQITHHGI